MGGSGPGRRLERTTARRLRAAFVVMALAGLAHLEGRAMAAPGARIVNGLGTHDHPAVGALLYGGASPIDDDNARSWCTGTMIGCRTFLTAAHCVDPDREPDHYWVYLQHVGVNGVESIVVHPDYSIAGFPAADLAVLRLEREVAAIAPVALVPLDPTTGVGMRGTIVGFGQTGFLRGDYGIKRAGRVTTGPCSGDLPRGLREPELLCWSFDAPLGEPGFDSNTCNGDSGGPLFLDFGTGPTLAGVTAGGTNGSCLAPDSSYDVSVYGHRDFVLATLTGDRSDRCAGATPLGGAGTSVVAVEGRLTAGEPSRTHAVAVDVGADALVVTVNGSDDGVFDVDLSLAPVGGAAVCTSDGAAAVATCIVDAPAPGQWTASVAAKSGDGDYQLTAVVLPHADRSCVPAAIHRASTRTMVDGERYRARLDVLDVGGRFGGLDPRRGFGLRVRAAPSEEADLVVSLSRDDPGWAGSSPERGRFRWRGRGATGGVRWIKAIDRTAADGRWRILVRGRAPGTAAATGGGTGAGVELEIDGVCARMDGGAGR